MRRAPFCLPLLFVLLLAADKHAVPLTFHVAPTGDDANPGTLDRPFATITRARDAIRALKRGGGTLPRPVTVSLRGGTYPLTATLEFTPQDSGSAQNPVVYTAHPGEKPILTGGRKITGWKQTQVNGKDLWVANIPEVRMGKWSFHQLWVDGVRRPRARHPNKGYFQIAELPDVTPKTPRYPGQKRFRYAPGDLARYSRLDEVDVVALHLWVAVRLAVTDIDAEKRLVHFARESRRTLQDGSHPARYYVENALELLDSPGEWYLDRGKGALYYAPVQGERFPDVEVVAPVDSTLVRFAGQPEKGEFVEHLTLRGLGFAHAEWWPARTDTVDVQAAAGVPAAVQADGLRHCRLDRCTLTHASNHGIHLARGCSHNHIERCHLFDLGAGGIQLGETTIRKSAAEQTHDNTVSDCHVHDVGQIFHQAVGIWVGQSGKNRIVHNHVHDLTYSGISVGWTWGYGPTLADDNLIEANHVHDLGKGLLSDMAGVYTLGKQPGTVIRGNVFHDITALRYGGWGIYFDEGSSDILAENNVVYRSTHGGFHQHYGKDNVVRNNIFALGRDAQVRRTRNEMHRSFTFERNIVYFAQGKLLDGNWEGTGYTLDNNLYFRTNGKVDAFGKWSFSQWQQRGQDRQSLWADPGFADPDKGDFRVKTDTPARKIGFVPFSTEGVGPRKDGR